MNAHKEPQIDLAVEDGAEDRVYGRYLATLIAFDEARAQQQPDFKRIECLKTSAEADALELEVMAMRLSHITRVSADSLQRDFLAAAESQIGKVIEAAGVAAEHSGESHPKIAKRRVATETSHASEKASNDLTTAGDELLATLRARGARAEKIRVLLKAESVAAYKAQMKEELAAGSLTNGSSLLTSQ